jgi:hypothetical protein
MLNFKQKISEAYKDTKKAWPTLTKENEISKSCSSGRTDMALLDRGFNSTVLS